MKTGKKFNLKLILGIFGAVVVGVVATLLILNGNKTNNEEEKDMNEFVTRFLKLENKSENVIYSPLSIKYALSILRDGAKGETKDEIETALGDDTLMKYQNVPEKLSLANALFVNTNFTGSVRDEYIDAVNEKYNAGVIYDDFLNKDLINDWVNEKTFGLIREVDLDVSEDTEMVISNALAIQMDWIYQFDGETEKESFMLKDGSKMDVPMMHHWRTFSDAVGYYDDDDLTVATLDLERMEDGTNLQFVAVMPKKGSLEEYAKTVTASEILGKLGEVKSASSTENGVNLAIPKFSFDYALDFKKDLKEMGIEHAFSQELADFSRMMDEENGRLYVSDAVHKATIEFSEKGIKAGATTQVELKVTGAIPRGEPVEITIDRPFLFMIYDKTTKEVWFVGTMYTPETWDGI